MAPFALIGVDYAGIKTPQFQFTHLHGADPFLDIEMASTGILFSRDGTGSLQRTMVVTSCNDPGASVCLLTIHVVYRPMATV
ncbi:hypothetical protein PF006_g10617 [Phytophthora fragariae]|uniref:Uncharacterized protein n=1 Tax=Phytophthora fragariae TaxID=53985 RepID=A0A6A3TZ51_9STRA|nr:hypothetical protein PF006_g10617 [Phytophthora fragariae]